MRQAILAAEVGDDAYREDPTVNALEETAAARTGKEGALLVPSSTMANLIALLVHTRPGGEVLLGDQSHIYRVEEGATRLGGLRLTALPNLPDGGLDRESVRSAVSGPREKRPSLLVLENTHNFCGGAVLGPETISGLAELVRQAGLRTHIDGARIFNAQVATGVSVAELVCTADSLSFCLSKGLSAPVGSLLCGSADFIACAREVRTMLGGSMRQAGVIAAAGLVALETMVDRLAEDHRNAVLLAAGLTELGFPVCPKNISSNIVIVPLDDTEAWQRQFEDLGVLTTVLSGRLLRFVTHAGISRTDVHEALGRIEYAVKRRQAPVNGASSELPSRSPTLRE